MSYHSQPKGWVEVLFNLSSKTPTPSYFSDLSESDYVMIGSGMPIQETNGPYDLYQMLYEKKFSGMPRPVRSFDLINVVERGAPLLTFAVIAPRDNYQFLSNFKTKNGANGKLEIFAYFPHGLMQMPSAFGSFKTRKHHEL